MDETGHMHLNQKGFIPGGHSRDGDMKPAMGVEKNDGVAWDGGQ